MWIEHMCKFRVMPLLWLYLQSIYKRNIRNLILEGLFIWYLMLRLPPILAGKRNWMLSFLWPSKMRFLIFCLHIVEAIYSHSRFRHSLTSTSSQTPRRGGTFLSSSQSRILPSLSARSLSLSPAKSADSIRWVPKTLFTPPCTTLLANESRRAQNTAFCDTVSV